MCVFDLFCFSQESESARGCVKREREKKERKEKKEERGSVEVEVEVERGKRKKSLSQLFPSLFSFLSFLTTKIYIDLKRPQLLRRNRCGEWKRWEVGKMEKRLLVQHIELDVGFFLFFSSFLLLLPLFPPPQNELR